MKRLVLLMLFAFPGAGLACGVCAEDRIAATYDHAVVTQATAKGHVVVFAAIGGAGDRRALADAARRTAAGLGGVDRGTVRVSPEPAALSFALDPRIRTPQQALADIERAARGTKLGLLKVVHSVAYRK
jgi:hypothetical protein